MRVWGEVLNEEDDIWIGERQGHFSSAYATAEHLFSETHLINIVSNHQSSIPLPSFPLPLSPP